MVKRIVVGVIAALIAIGIIVLRNTGFARCPRISVVRCNL